MDLRLSSLPGHRAAALFLAVMLLAVPSWAEQRAYDDELPRKVTTVIPTELIQGEFWKVGAEVQPVEGLFAFQVATPWGDFPVYGEAMLRLRLKEFRAIAQLEDISDTEASFQGLGRSVKKSFVRLGNAFIHPKRTARAMPQGTRRLFGKLDRYSKKIKQALEDSPEAEEQSAEDADSTSSTQQAAVWLARKYGGVSSKSRRRARDAGVDPYTSNELLAAELERLARAEAVGSVSAKFFMPAMAGAVGLLADAANIAYIQEWRELFALNAQLMGDMGVSEELILALETSEYFTPMTQTLLVAMLDAMEGVQHRPLVIEQAVLLENESEALFFLESVMLAEWYHREESPLKKFLFDTLIPVASNGRGNLVAFTAADYLYWTPGTEQVTRDFTATYAQHPGGRELLMADYISPRAAEEVAALGWKVMPNLRLDYDVEIPWGRQDQGAGR